MTATRCLINLDKADSSQYIDATLYLETTKILDRLYGRHVAQKYFTKHFCFDSIVITVK